MPYGNTVQYIIPHSETITLSKALKEKGVRLIEVRGTWPMQNMNLVRGLYDYGILRNPEIEVNGTKAGLMTLIGDYLVNSEEGKTTKLYGYALHVEVVGTKDGEKKKRDPVSYPPGFRRQRGRLGRTESLHQKCGNPPGDRGRAAG